MKVLVVYDSVFGNTEKIARSIATGLSGNDVKVASAQEAGPQDWKGLDMLIVGCPTQAWTSTVAINGLIHSIPDSAMAGVKAATFDTRVRSRLSGSAAPKIEKALKKNGVRIIAPPQAFFVKGRSGPLVEGEAERAAEWAKQLLAA